VSQTFICRHRIAPLATVRIFFILAHQAVIWPRYTNDHADRGGVGLHDGHQRLCQPHAVFRVIILETKSWLFEPPASTKSWEAVEAVT